MTKACEEWENRVKNEIFYGLRKLIQFKVLLETKKTHDF